jgi:hypothetical protein
MFEYKITSLSVCMFMHAQQVAATTSRYCRGPLALASLSIMDGNRVLGESVWVAVLLSFLTRHHDGRV